MRVYIFILAFFIILFPPTPTVLINIEKHSPTIIIVSLGINDYGVIANKNKIKEHAEKLINLAAQKNIKVVWLIPAVKKKSSQYIYDSVKDSGAIIFDARKL